MTIPQILSIIGVPSIITIIGFLVKLARQVKILMKAQQAQMRSALLQLYYKYTSQGWIYQDDLDDFENQYQSYHALGKNGVMDAKREEILKLPTKQR